MKYTLLYLLILNCLVLPSLTLMGEEDTEDTDNTSKDAEESASSRGKSFFFFGTLLSRIRKHWLGKKDPTAAPLYAGPSYPLGGYYNCPTFGCNPGLVYRPAAFEQASLYNYPSSALSPIAPIALQPQHLPPQLFYPQPVPGLNGYPGIAWAFPLPPPPLPPPPPPPPPPGAVIQEFPPRITVGASSIGLGGPSRVIESSGFPSGVGGIPPFGAYPGAPLSATGGSIPCTTFPCSSG